MTFTYDPTTVQGQVRQLIGDVDSTTPIFSDAEIANFLVFEGSDPRLAAAQGLETRAIQVASLVEIKLSDGTTVNGSKVADALRQAATALRDRAEGAFDWAEQVVDPFSARERIWNQWLRQIAAAGDAENP